METYRDQLEKWTRKKRDGVGRRRGVNVAVTFGGNVMR